MDSQPNNSVYDQDSETPTTRPDLLSLEEANSPSGAAKPNSSKTSDDLAKTADKKTADGVGVGASSEASAGIGSEGPGGGKTSGLKGAAGKIVGTLGQNKKKFAVGGGIIGGVVTCMILAFTIFVPLIIEHIGQVILAEESALEHKFEGEAAKELAKELAKHGIPKPPKSPDNPNPDEPSAEDTGNPLDEETKSFDWEDPQIQSSLENQGLSVETNPDGTFKGIVDSSGNDITGELADNTNGAWDNFEKAVPEWDYGQQKGFLDLIQSHAGADVSGLPEVEGKDNSEEDVNKQIEGEILDPANDGTTVADLQKAADNGGADSGSPDGPAGQAIQAAQADEVAGKSASQIEADAEGKLGGGEDGASKGLLFTLLADGCSLESVASTASKDRIPTIITLLIRHSSLLFSVISQIHTGKITAGQVNGVMNTLEGESATVTINKDSKGNPTTIATNSPSTSFANSSAWQTAIGNNNGVQDSSNPDGTSGATSSTGQSKVQGLLPDPSTLPVPNTGQKIVDIVNSIFTDSGLGAICGLVNSKLGFIVGFFAGVGQIASEIADGGLTAGAGAVAEQAGIIAANIAFIKLITPLIINYFTPFALYGLENGAQWLNNADMGSNLSYGDYSRKLGANPVNYSTAGKQIAEANIEQSQSDKYLPIGEKLFAISNTNSLLSRVMNTMPLGKSAMFDSMIGYITNFPSFLSHSLSMIASPKIFAASSSVPPGQQYGIAQYSFQDNEVNKYDIYQNEAYLYKNITYNGKSKTRISMLGDPNQYLNVSSKNPDTNINDLEHCYVDSYSDIIESNNSLGTNCSVQIDSNNFSQSCNLPAESNINQGCVTIGDYSSANISGLSNETFTNDLNKSLDNQICVIYTTDLENSQNQNNTYCDPGIKAQINDDIGHFRQYILDINVMGNYTALNKLSQ
jgi:hypothetical protein